MGVYFITECRNHHRSRRRVSTISAGDDSQQEDNNQQDENQSLHCYQHLVDFKDFLPEEWNMSSYNYLIWNQTRWLTTPDKIAAKIIWKKTQTQKLFQSVFNVSMGVHRKL